MSLSTASPDALQATLSARRYLAARDLDDAWREALDAGVKLGLNNEARLVFGCCLRRARERANGELYRDLLRLGEPVEAGGRRFAIDTHEDVLVIEPAGPVWLDGKEEHGC